MAGMTADGKVYKYAVGDGGAIAAYPIGASQTLYYGQPAVLSGSGSVTDQVSGYTTSSFGSESVAGNSTVILTANVGSNSVFSGWSGACSGTSSGRR